VAIREGDRFSVVSSKRPQNLAALLDAVRGCRRVAELGTGSAWTSISLLLADRERELVSYDPIHRSERNLYLRLVAPELRSRVDFIHASGSVGPHNLKQIDLLYIDRAYQRGDTIREVEAWRPALAPGALIVFDEFDHPDHPGAREAVNELGLEGEQRANMFVHRTPL
jgi:predicted O-methyltransferase YrrM